MSIDEKALIAKISKVPPGLAKEVPARILWALEALDAEAKIEIIQFTVAVSSLRENNMILL
jgi:hypothetical protein